MSLKTSLRGLAALVPALLGVFTANALAEAPFPRLDQPVLASVELRGPWQFRFDPADEGAISGWHGAITNAAQWEAITIPRVWNIPDGAVSGRVAQAVGWYQLRVPVPPTWDQDVSLAFLGAQHVADVWVNGEYLGVHRGGFTPFQLDVTAQARVTNELRVAVRVSNVLDNNTVPARHAGWQSYGGLCREVYLLHQPAVRPASVAVSTRLAADRSCVASVSVPFRRMPPHGSRLRASLEVEQEVVATAECAISTNPAAPSLLEFAVENPRLWSPATPVLHRLTLEWEGGRHAMPIGLRSLRIDGERLLLNEEPIWLQGFGQHEIAPGNGPIVPRDLRRRDLQQMKRVFDANIIRPGHYPNHPDLYNLCDELGLLVFSEIPIWQISAHVLASEDVWDVWLEPQLREMAESLRHHPSVCFWGVANETRGAHSYYRRAADFVRGLDPSRPVCVVLEPTVDLDATPIFDMVARNFHFGWHHSRDVYEGPAIAAGIFAATRGKPFWIAETGAIATRGSLGGGYSGQARGTETYLDRILRFNFSHYATVTNPVVGVTVWSWTDFFMNGRSEEHAILDISRQPKLAAYSLRNLMHGDLRVFAVEQNSYVAGDGSWQAELRTFNRLQAPREGLTARWTVLKGQTKVGGGERAFDARAERSQSIGAIEWVPAADALPGLYTVWTELMDDRGRIHVSSCSFDLGNVSCPGVLLVPPPTVEDTERWVALGGVRIPVSPLVGLQIPLEEGIYDLTFGEGAQTQCTAACTIRRAEFTQQPWPGR